MRFLGTRRAGLALALGLLATQGRGQAASPRPRPSTRAAGVAVAKPEPLAQGLCDALHTLPAKRRSACCGTTPTSLAGVCAQELSASLRRGAVSVDAAAIDRCARDAARGLEGCDWITPLPPRPPAACGTVILGKLQDGATCRSSLECGEGLYCRGVTPGGSGVCAPPAPAHARCEVPADNLGAFTGFRDDPRHPTCDGVCLKGQCMPFAPAGGACTSSAFCAPGLQCLAGRCQQGFLPRVGEACPGHTACEVGAICQAGRCVALKNAGEPCSLPFECRALACDKAAGAKDGTCGDPCGGAGKHGARAPR